MPHNSQAVVVGLAMLWMLLPSLAGAANDGLARTPPMGWRSWNAFNIDINQEAMEQIMDRMTERIRLVDGIPTSLADLGYTDASIDDGWQAVGTGVNGSFHDEEGRPLINHTKFPDMARLTEYGHSRGLKVGWYMNNCNNKEMPSQEPGYEERHMRGDVEAIVGFGFDGVKLDGCGPYKDLSWWYGLLNATGRPVLVENCHWGGEAPPCPGGNCPYHYFRVSGDITNTWASMFNNIQKVPKYLGDPPLSAPGQWAYPDMMEVGQLASFEEDRAHFGLWAITSSPLILGLDLRNASTLDRVWPVIANPEVIAINQAWVGHPGRLVKEYRREFPVLLVNAEVCEEGPGPQSDWYLQRATHELFLITSRSTGRCVDARDSSHVTLEPCAGSNSQLFAYDQDERSLRAPLWKDNEGQLNGCLDISGKVGPRVQLTNCRGSPNEEFEFSDDGVWSGGSGAYPFPKRCMQYANKTVIEAQVWSKLQPRGAVAVLVVNNGTAPRNFDVDLLDLNLTVGGGITYSSRDLWMRADIGSIADTLSTPRLEPHDSSFYLLQPETAMLSSADYTESTILNLV